MEDPMASAQPYIILRAPHARTVEPFSASSAMRSLPIDAPGSRGFRMNAPSIGVEALSIDSFAEATLHLESLTASDVHAAAADPRTVSVAPPMPISLIAPMGS